ncbi:MAG: DUF4132 domain-containing protein [Polyangiaceae bacterium]
MTVRIVWTDEAKKQLTPRTAADVRLKRPKRETLWAKLGEIARDPKLVRNLDGEMRDRFGAEMPATADLEALTALVLASDLESTGNDVLDAAGRLYGAATLVELGVAVHDAKGYPRHASLMRRALLLASPEDRAAAMKRAEALFSSATLNSQTVLAYAFFERPEWSEAAARASLEPADAGVARPRASHADALLLLPQLTDPELAGRVFKARARSSSHVDMVAALGEAALPLLTANFATPMHSADLEYTAEALALFESEDVARLLVTELAKKEVRGPATGFFMRFPAIAKRVLPEVAKGKTKVARLAAEWLEQAGRAVDASPPAASGSRAEAPAAAEGTAEGHAHLVPVELRSLPTGKPPKRSKRKVLDVAFPPRPGRLAWTDPDLPLMLRAAVAARRVGPLLEGDALARYRAETMASARQAFGWTARVDNVMRALPDGLMLELWNHNMSDNPYQAGSGSHMLAVFGLDAVPGFFRNARSGLARAGLGLFALAVDAVASLVLERLDDEPDVAWLYARYRPEAALRAAIPLAVGALGKPRDRAESFLRGMNEGGEGARLRALAGELGPLALEAVEEVLAVDASLVDFSTKPPKLPESFRPESFTRPCLKSGDALPLSAVEVLGCLAARSAPWRMHPALRAVKAACDARSLGQLAWDMAHAWFNSGKAKRDEWMLEALVHLADDEVTRRTTPDIRDKRVLPVLGWTGTDAAATELLTVMSRSVGQRSWSPFYPADMASAAFESIAGARGLTTEELADRVVTTLGLTGRGQMSLDVGGRTIQAGLDARFEVYVVADDGKIVKKMPSARKDDDPKKLAAAKTKLAELAEDAQAMLVLRAESLRRAMVHGRTWSAADFARLWCEHPLQRLLGEGVVWQRMPDGATFRVAEDGSLADADDEALTVGDDHTVAVADPRRLDAALLAKWRERFLEYRIVQHFAQIDAPAAAPSR